MMTLMRLLVASIFLLPGPAVEADREDAIRHEPVHREVAVTIDDLPAVYGDIVIMSDVTKKLLRSIQMHEIPAAGFVNESKLFVWGEIDARIELLKMWLDAGLELGNHTYSHPLINRTSLPDYKEDVIRGETVLRRLLSEKGRTLRYFRHPQLRTGPTPEYKKALDSFLAGRGYTIAPVTIDNNDYIFASVYRRARRRDDRKTMDQVVSAYIPYMEEIFEFFEKRSREVLGYEVRQVLLLHASELNADHFEDLVQMIKKRGYRFIPLEEALKDQAYRLPDVQCDRGLSWLHRWALAKNMDVHEEPQVPEFIAALFNEKR